MGRLLGGRHASTRGTLWSVGLNCGCLLGTLSGPEVRESVAEGTFAYKKPAVGQPWEDAPVGYASDTVAKWAIGMPLSPEDIYVLQEVNDSYDGQTPDRRYLHVRGWLKNELCVKEECEAWDAKVAKERRARGL